MVSSNTGHDIIVIGASAGGLAPLRDIVRSLPKSLPASVFVVMHLSPSSPRMLVDILNQTGALPAEWARNGMAFEPGRIYVAPPDRHMVIKATSISVVNGPRENHSRPSIDVTFRSAARAYADRVAAVVLSGALNDGTYGALVVKSIGGTVIAQEPSEAENPSMPSSVQENVAIDYVARAADIGPLLVQLAPSSPYPSEIMSNMRVTETDETEEVRTPDKPPPGSLVPYVCPDCGGAVWMTGAEKVIHFQCHTGHSFTGEVLLALQSEAVESALWTAVRIISEQASLLRRISSTSEGIPASAITTRHLERAEELEGQGSLIRKMLVGPAVTSDANLR